MPAPDVIPQLYYESTKDAVEWLCRVFRFTEDWRLAGPEGVLYMAVLRCPEGGGVMISGLAAGTGAQPRPNPFYSVTVMVPDVDAHFAHARGEGPALSPSPPTSRGACATTRSST
jgi:uncharacterized glyoxalase superfamily protein PhnB